jgi:hypothetical protein
MWIIHQQGFFLSVFIELIYLNKTILVIELRMDSDLGAIKLLSLLKKLAGPHSSIYFSLIEEDGASNPALDKRPQTCRIVTTLKILSQVAAHRHPADHHIYRLDTS